MLLALVDLGGFNHAAGGEIACGLFKTGEGDAFRLRTRINPRFAFGDGDADRIDEIVIAQPVGDQRIGDGSQFRV